MIFFPFSSRVYEMRNVARMFTIATHRLASARCRPGQILPPVMVDEEKNSVRMKGRPTDVQIQTYFPDKAPHYQTALVGISGAKSRAVWCRSSHPMS